MLALGARMTSGARMRVRHGVMAFGLCGASFYVAACSGSSSSGKGAIGSGGAGSVAGSGGVAAASGGSLGHGAVGGGERAGAGAVDGSSSCGARGPSCFGGDLSGCCANDPYPSDCVNGQWVCTFFGRAATPIPPPGCDGTQCTSLHTGGSSAQAGAAGADEAGSGGQSEGGAPS